MNDGQQDTDQGPFALRLRRFLFCSSCYGRYLGVKIFTATDSLVVLTARRRRNRQIVARHAEVDEREAIDLSESLLLWDEHSMFGGPQLPSGPDLQQVADDDENGARHGRSLHPVPGAVQHLQTAALLLNQERDAAEVGVGGDADGADRHRVLQRRVVGRPQVGARVGRTPVALPVSVSLGQQTRATHGCPADRPAHTHSPP